MNSDKLQELRRLAEQATQGEWTDMQFRQEDKSETVVSEGYKVVCHTMSHSKRFKDAAFIAAANPATILQLLDLLEASEASRHEQNRTICLDCDEKRKLLDEIERLQIEQEEDELFYKSSIESFKSSIERVVIEVEKLKAENTLLYTKLNECIKHTEQAEAQCAELKREILMCITKDVKMSGNVYTTINASQVHRLHEKVREGGTV